MSKIAKLLKDGPIIAKLCKNSVKNAKSIDNIEKNLRNFVKIEHQLRNKKIKDAKFNIVVKAANESKKSWNLIEIEKKDWKIEQNYVPIELKPQNYLKNVDL